MAKKILIIEDYPDTYKMIADILKKEKYKPIIAGDAIVGLEKAIMDKPDLILLDIMMPEMNGIEVCHKLKNNPETSKIPVIFVTVKRVEDGMKLGREAGADAYIKKPFNPDELLRIVEVILKKHGGPR